MKEQHAMWPMFSPEGEAALLALVQHRPLLAFDFDGTLAPIVPYPDAARVAPAMAAVLQALATRLPVAIVTGRAVRDVRPRLGFEPHFVVGNHGAEDEHDPAGGIERAATVLAPLRLALADAAAALAAAGVWAEDKGASLALHYRLAPRPAEAQALIATLLKAVASPALQIFAGKMVVNAVPAAAPDKADAVHRLVKRCGAGAALFGGDDINDEPVFVAAPPHWLTLRVGATHTPTRARFGIDSPQQMLPLLQRILALHDAAAASR
jgi:trehalose 6-phosphate phosphatase